MLRLSAQYMAYNFPRYSPMIQPVNDVMMRLIDSGSIDHIFTKWSPFRSMKNQVNCHLTSFFIAYSRST